MEPTFDPDIGLEEQAVDYWRYFRFSNGDRWEVFGHCDRRGFCLIGAVVETIRGLEQIRDLDHLAAICNERNVSRPDSEFDVPVTLGFSGCCPLKVRML